MAKNFPFIIWECPFCDEYNITENHSDPDSHFVSMECEHCAEELEECLCGFATGTEEITAFFKRPGITKSGICLEAEISQQYLNRVLSGVQPLTHSLLETLLPVLLDYGFRNNRKAPS